MRIRLGQKVVDRVTGFEGTAVARVEYLNGCVQFCVRPAMGADGKMPSGEYIDVEQLDVTGAENIRRKSQDAKSGGSMADIPGAQYSG